MYRFIVILFFIALPAFAVEPLASNLLLQQCSSDDNVSRLACRSWIHGFIGGANATRIAREAATDQNETFSERATRTRSAPPRRNYGQNYDAQYCVPSGTTIDELADKLIAHAAGLKQMPDNANQLMLGVLRKNYPCRGSKN